MRRQIFGLKTFMPTMVSIEFRLVLTRDELGKDTFREPPQEVREREPRPIMLNAAAKDSNVKFFTQIEWNVVMIRKSERSARANDSLQVSNSKFLKKYSSLLPKFKPANGN